MKILQRFLKILNFQPKTSNHSYIFATLSFSSTVVKTHLTQSVLILLDRWKRYKHCDAEENQELKILTHYINDEENLTKCLNSIK